MSTIAILGCTGTIGRHLASRLAAMNHRLILLARDAGKLDAIHEQFDGSLHSAAVCDFSSSDAVKTAIEERLDGQSLGGIVNCIGSLLLKPAHGTSDADFRATVEANLFTAFATVRTAALLMRQQGGSVVLFASAAAEIGLQNHEAIAAAKAGVIGLARAAAASYAHANIRINVISPGLTKTDLTRRIWENATSAAASTDMHALGRLGEPKHIVSAATWLLDSENDWITGEVLNVDGGLAHVIPRKKI